MVTKKKKVQRIPEAEKVVKESSNKMVDSEDVKKKVVGKTGLGTIKVEMIANGDTPKMQYAKGRIYSVDKKQYKMIEKSCILYKPKSNEALSTNSINVNR